MPKARDGKLLLELVEDIVTAYVERGSWIRQSVSVMSGEHTGERGIFVRLKKREQAQGSENQTVLACVGYPIPRSDLVGTATDVGINIAVRARSMLHKDFSDISDLTLELSVLTPLGLIRVERPLDYPKSITLGRDGILVERGFQRGLVLPQAALEYGWSKEELLSESCMKAGFFSDAWLVQDLRVYKFQAEIFRRRADGKIARTA